MNLFNFLTYDAVRDFDTRLPVRRRQQTYNVQRTATTTTNDKNVHEGPDKLYSRRTTTNNSGATVYELDSTDVRTATNVQPSITAYDLFVFDKYKRQVKYKHFDWDLYKLIKAEAFSQSIDGKPISYRVTADLPKFKNRKGCGQRYMNNYFKAMNEAFQMEQNNAPIPDPVG